MVSHARYEGTSCPGESARSRGMHGAEPRGMRGRLRGLFVCLLSIAVPAGAWGSTSPVATADLARGKALFQKQCAACHGNEGRGDGPAAYLLSPRPRDLRAARYRLVSTWEGVATDDDLFRTITRGIPGSAMPSWGHLSEADRWALVRFVRTLGEKPVEIAAPSPPGPGGGVGKGVIGVPPEPADASTNLEQGRQMFQDACASCHGPLGKGDGPQELKDEEGRPTKARDLTSGVFKSEPTPENLFRRIVTGMPGTPMTGNDWAHADGAGWYLVRYVLSLSSPEMRERAEMRRYQIKARRVEKLPQHPDDWLWTEVEPVHLHLMPLWWRYTRPEEVVVKAVHDGKDIALLLSWADDTHDATAIRPQDFRDAAAVSFPIKGEPPFFAMGEPGSPVNVWMWKAERQADLDQAFQDIEREYPNLGIDSYPNLERGPLEQPHRYALTVDADPTFVTAWGVGNIVADPERKDAAEDLSAQGFGTLRARATKDQKLRSQGVWSIGSYRVMLRRSLAGDGADSVPLAPGKTTPVSFGIWDGHYGDRDGKKSVTIWQDLSIER